MWSEIEEAKERKEDKSMLNGCYKAWMDTWEGVNQHLPCLQ